MINLCFSSSCLSCSRFFSSSIRSRISCCCLEVISPLSMMFLFKSEKETTLSAIIAMIEKVLSQQPGGRLPFTVFASMLEERDWLVNCQGLVGGRSRGEMDLPGSLAKVFCQLSTSGFVTVGGLQNTESSPNRNGDCN